MQKWFGGLIVGFLLVAACGDDGSNVDADSDQLFTSLCDTAFRCCSRGEVDDLLGPFVDEENCSDRLSQLAHVRSGLVFYSLPLEDFGFQLPNVSLLELAVKQNRARLVGSAVDECLNFLGEIPCNSADDEEIEGCVPQEPLPEGACDLKLLIEGKVGDGGACTSSNPSFECKEGLSCVQVSSLGTDGVCVETGIAGDFCYFNSECSEDLFCNVFDGKCEALHGEGQPCEFVDPDDSNPDPRPLSQGGDVVVQCEEHLSCDPIFDLCVPGCVQGAPCFSDFQCNEDEGLHCLFVNGLGRCDVQRGVGLPCANDDNCSDGLFCDFNPASPGERICFNALANNETCSRNLQCESGYCDNLFPGTNTCLAKVADGSACLSRRDDQCVSGYCEIRSVVEIGQIDTFPNGFCSIDNDCPGASTCDLTRSQCTELCRAQAADGVTCALNAECMSENCVGVQQFVTPGQCQTVPLLDGQICSSDFQCQSEFCNPLSNLCQTLPLANGDQCTSDFQCASNVCDSVCVEGLAAGADCATERCATALYCDRSITPSLCVAKHQAGEQCESSLECHGACREIFGRFRCDTTPVVDAFVCDGI
jgi:hypothetical protein